MVKLRWDATVSERFESAYNALDWMMKQVLYSALCRFTRWTYLFTLIALTDAKEYCHNQDFVAECPDPGEVILMENASYGRMKVGPCVKMDFGFVGCSVDVLGHTHGRCSGRKSCVIRVPDGKLDGTRPCNDDLKSYLEANFRCIPVSTSDDTTPCKLTVDSENSTGYIAPPPPVDDSDSVRIRCGSETEPWIVAASAGQRLNVTLMDFTSPADDQPSTPGLAKAPPLTGSSTVTSSPSSSSSSSSLTSFESCDLPYAVIEEDGDPSPGRVRVCGSGSVETTHAYSSNGDVIKVVLIARKVADRSRFLLKYEAIGCPDVTQTPPNVWLRRETDRMTAGCVTSEVTWQLVCVGNRWEGSVVNCSIVSSRNGRRDEGQPGLSAGASILIIVIVSIAIGVCVLLLGLYYIKRGRGGLPFGVRAHQLRDMKPLSSDAAYEPASVYARNSAFDPAAPPPGTANRLGPKGLALEEGNEYEYVWDVPSNAVPPGVVVIGGGGGRSIGQRTASAAAEEARFESRPPDLIKGGGGGEMTGTVHCSCLSSSTKPPRDEGERDGGATRFPSLEWRYNKGTTTATGRRGIGGGGRGGRKPRREGLEGPPWTGADAVGTCRHCGHSVEPATSSRAAMATTMTLRPFPTFHSTTDAGRRGRLPDSVAPVTLPRSERH